MIMRFLENVLKNVMKSINMKLMNLIEDSVLLYVPHAQKTVFNVKLDLLDQHVLIAIQVSVIDLDVFNLVQQAHIIS